MDTLQCFDSTCCSIEAVVSVDERGQIVLPKELRDKFGVRAGDKFVIASLQRDASLCCIAFIKADALNSIVAEQIAPLFK
ncbi:MAG: AbrB/MazE/SpoVT family DNA-binding domain-containing protein [Spirochaetes bacterium]|jgi:AbrB family looped-hinge helix DNA binding protein|nr:AbrB/MazE/SpoVT family DNA-binding domain-containing protein [Spirochaetota bacterium]